jgi:hypothetical protein
MAHHAMTRSQVCTASTAAFTNIQWNVEFAFTDEAAERVRTRTTAPCCETSKLVACCLCSGCQQG